MDPTTFSPASTSPATEERAWFDLSGDLEARVYLVACGVISLLSAVLHFWTVFENFKERPTKKEVFLTLLMTSIGAISLSGGWNFLATALNYGYPMTCADKALWAGMQLHSCPEIKLLWDSLKGKELWTTLCDPLAESIPGSVVIRGNTWLVQDGTISEIRRGLLYEVIELFKRQVYVPCNVKVCPLWAAPTKEYADYLAYLCRSYF